MEHDGQCQYEVMVRTFEKKTGVKVEGSLRKQIGAKGDCCSCRARQLDPTFFATMDDHVNWGRNFVVHWQLALQARVKEDSRGPGFMAGGIKKREVKLADKFPPEGGQGGQVIEVDFRNRRKL